jgi:hypothetical protein
MLQVFLSSNDANVRESPLAFPFAPFRAIRRPCAVSIKEPTAPSRSKKRKIGVIGINTRNKGDGPCGRRTNDGAAAPAGVPRRNATEDLQ